MTRFIIAFLLLAFPALAGQPGETVGFRAICNTPDPLAKMSSVQQEHGMEAGNSFWYAAVQADECILLPATAVGILVDRLGSWRGTYEGKEYRWSLWSVEYKGIVLYGLFPDDEDGPSA